MSLPVAPPALSFHFLFLMVSFVPVFVDYDFGDVFPAVPSVPSTDWEGGQSPLLPSFPCQACCMIQNQLDTYNHVNDRTKAQPGVLIDGILQEESSTSSPRPAPPPGQDSCLPLASGLVESLCDGFRDTLVSLPACGATPCAVCARGTAGLGCSPGPDPTSADLL